MLPNILLVKRGDKILAELINCRPGGEMFWIACECHPRPEFEEVASIFRKIEGLPDGNQEQADRLYQQIFNMGIVLEDPSSGNQWIYFHISFIDDGKVEVRY